MNVIVGGGVMGLTLAYTLATRGQPVTLLERGRIGQGGASAVPVALLNPYRGRSARATDFDVSGLSTMQTLVRRLDAAGYDTGVDLSGVVRVASNPKQARAWRHRAGTVWFERDDAPTGFYAPFGGFVAVGGGWLEPARWLGCLSDAARAKGANIVAECAVEGFETDPRGTLLKTAVGDVRAARVFFCTGIDETLGQDAVGLEHVAGEVITLDAPGAYPEKPLAGAVYGVAQRGYYFLGGNHRPAYERDARAPQQLQSAGSWFVPALKEATVVGVWHGVRAKTASNLPVVQKLAPHLWFVGALAGRGFLCSAKVAAELAERLLD